MKSFNFNDFSVPEWEVTLQNEETPITLVYPSVDAIERFSKIAPELPEAIERKDFQVIDNIYQIFTDFFNCNKEKRTFTVEELKKQIHLELLEPFTMAYLEFVSEAKKVKN
jgi:hypothetical protein